MKLVYVGLVVLAVISAPIFAMPSFPTEYKGQYNIIHQPGHYLPIVDVLPK